VAEDGRFSLTLGTQNFYWLHIEPTASR
jgi:maltose alpha-D-glucosyltransferase/alpha-amylase